MIATNRRGATGKRDFRGRLATRALPILLAVAAVWVAGIPALLQGGPITLDLRRRTIFGHPTTGVHDLLDTYVTPNGRGIAYLDPENLIHPLERGGGQLYHNFFNVLGNAFPQTAGWRFVGDARAISDGALKVHTYDAEGSDVRVGGLFDVEYAPAANTVDPTASLHWIQVVSDNHNVTANPGHGNLENVVDIAGGNATPYYDRSFAADSRNLLDFSRRSDVEAQHDWIAALFLVSGPTVAGTAANPSVVTVYNNAAILWGWKNRFFRNVAAGAFHDAVDRDILAGLPEEQFVAYHDEFHAELVAPEPSTLILLAIGAVPLAWCRRRRRHADHLAT